MPGSLTAKAGRRSRAAAGAVADIAVVVAGAEQELVAKPNSLDFSTPCTAVPQPLAFCEVWSREPSGSDVVGDRAVGVDACRAEQLLVVVALEAEHVGDGVALVRLGDVAVDVRLPEPAVVGDARKASASRCFHRAVELHHRHFVFVDLRRGEGVRPVEVEELDGAAAVTPTSFLAPVKLRWNSLPSPCTPEVGVHAADLASRSHGSRRP